MDRSYSFRLARENAMNGADVPQHEPMLMTPITTTMAVITGFIIAFSGGIALFPLGVAPADWKDVARVVVGAAIMIGFGALRILRFLRTRAGQAKPLDLAVDASGIRATADSVTPIVYSWQSMTSIETPHGGVLLAFGDRASYWIPRQAFASVAERDTFVWDVGRMLPAPKREG